MKLLSLKTRVLIILLLPLTITLAVQLNIVVVTIYAAIHGLASWCIGIDWLISVSDYSYFNYVSKVRPVVPKPDYFYTTTVTKDGKTFTHTCPLEGQSVSGALSTAPFWRTKKEKKINYPGSVMQAMSLPKKPKKLKTKKVKNANRKNSPSSR